MSDSRSADSSSADSSSADSRSAGFRRGALRRLVDRVMTALARRGAAPGGAVALTVVGRRSGEPRSLPLTPLPMGGRVHLVAPYGVVGWVKDLRAAGEVMIERGGSPMRVRAIELSAAEAAPVLREYVRRIPIVRPSVGADPSEGPAAFEAIAAAHPVFAIERLG